MIVTYPKDQFEQERLYALQTIFIDFCGYEVTFKGDKQSKNYTVEIENNFLVLEDHFFNVVEDKYYINASNLPDAPKNFTSKIYSENLIILYGKNKELFGDENVIGIDIVATVFFLLSGWEEYLFIQNNIVDSHGRPNQENLYLVRHNLHERPIVNEYVEYLKFFLSKLGIRPIKNRSFKFTPTFDIDHIYKWNGINSSIRTLAKFIIKRNFKDVYISINNISKVILDKKLDLFFSFNYLFDLLNRYNLRGEFYVMSSKRTNRDSGYSLFDKNFNKVIQEIKTNHIIGFHPSYYTLNNNNLFKTELNSLQENTQSEVEHGRNHYLRYNIINTYRAWEDNGIKFVSNRGFSGLIGFKAGVCYPYRPFDFILKKTFKLTERPFVFMETGYLEASKSTTFYERKINNLIKIIKSYNGEMVILWHNSNLYFKPYSKHRDLLNSIFKNASKEQ